MPQLVLIETYWNVKHYHLIVYDWIPRINRNILECKEESPTFAELGTSVLIETYWNVKEHGHITSRSGCSGINRNILECKDSYFSTYKSDLERY